jgi:hypothetical protein
MSNFGFNGPRTRQLTVVLRPQSRTRAKRAAAWQRRVAVELRTSGHDRSDNTLAVYSCRKLLRSAGN